MRSFVKIAVAVMLLFSIAGCVSTVHYVDKQTGEKIDSHSIVHLFSPSQTITHDKERGQPEKTYANADRAPLLVIAPAMIGSATAGIIASQVKCTIGCAPTTNVSISGAEAAAKAVATATGTGGH